MTPDAETSQAHQPPYVTVILGVVGEKGGDGDGEIRAAKRQSREEEDRLRR